MNTYKRSPILRGDILYAERVRRLALSRLAFVQ